MLAKDQSIGRLATSSYHNCANQIRLASKIFGKQMRSSDQSVSPGSKYWQADNQNCANQIRSLDESFANKENVGYRAKKLTPFSQNISQLLECLLQMSPWIVVGAIQF